MVKFILLVALSILVVAHGRIIGSSRTECESQVAMLITQYTEAGIRAKNLQHNSPMRLVESYEYREPKESDKYFVKLNSTVYADTAYLEWKKKIDDEISGNNNLVKCKENLDRDIWNVANEKLRIAYYASLYGYIFGSLYGQSTSSFGRLEYSKGNLQRYIDSDCDEYIIEAIESKKRYLEGELENIQSLEDEVARLLSEAENKIEADKPRISRIVHSEVIKPAEECYENPLQFERYEHSAHLADFF